MKVPSCGAVVVEQNGGGGLEAAPRCRSRSWSRLGTGGKPCKPPCRGSSLPGPEAARSPALICTYPCTGSCRCKGSTGGLIGHSEKGGETRQPSHERDGRRSLGGFFPRAWQSRTRRDGGRLASENQHLANGMNHHSANYSASGFPWKSMPGDHEHPTRCLARTWPAAANGVWLQLGL